MTDPVAITGTTEDGKPVVYGLAPSSVTVVEHPPAEDPLGSFIPGESGEEYPCAADES